MLFIVNMEVCLPHDMPEADANALKARERDIAQGLQRRGVWRHLWRVTGKYANVSIFDVADNTQLHDTLMSLPLFPYMKIDVRPLCRHPSSIHDDDR
ncbi:muconolactone delta-isomerase [Robbsia andropogonis]|uniref:Muconolactone Delta-isomerase n=1 Tax=Robbsia andropogonis TaxID=28092 RepID=A0A0F5JY69_9BURK|nr:muconolactone Delta-isomerase [Robbsia andropogonis]KKB62831.1 muconolactone delta-isomerase [Robbsia andropogonis]MCP1118082.1 muconolactone Delta-isomerase [Robbsia andropogonis]MCP1127637.1 muconolactone Delta-isomerase [Robbsia andropogonis]